MNNVILIGRLTSDPELKFLQGNNTAVAQFTLAVDKGLSKQKRQEFEQQGKPTADFPRIKVWGKQAENVASYCSKGKLIAVQGRIETGSYTKDDGQKVYTTDVNAFNVQFLEWGDNNENNNSSQQSSQDGGFRTSETPTDEDIPF